MLGGLRWICGLKISEGRYRWTFEVSVELLHVWFPQLSLGDSSLTDMSLGMNSDGKNPKILPRIFVHHVHISHSPTLSFEGTMVSTE